METSACADATANVEAIAVEAKRILRIIKPLLIVVKPLLAKLVIHN
jgi:hypothetical protein